VGREGGVAYGPQHKTDAGRGRKKVGRQRAVGHHPQHGIRLTPAKGEGGWGGREGVGKQA
jgi:hypothetical protein